MASEIEILRDKIRRLDLEKELLIFIEEDSPEIVRRVQSQLLRGELSTGEKITPSYKSGYYARKKFEQNSTPGYGTPDAFRTGEFFKGMGVLADRKEYIVDSNVVRKSLLQYGENLLKLSDENKTEYIQTTLINHIKDYIRLEIGNVFD